MYAKHFIDSTKGLKKKSTYTAMSESNKGAVVGAMLGAGVGGFIAYSRNKSVLVFACVGAVIGGAISKSFIK